MFYSTKITTSTILQFQTSWSAMWILRNVPLDLYTHTNSILLTCYITNSRLALSPFFFPLLPLAYPCHFTIWGLLLYIYFSSLILYWKYLLLEPSSGLTTIAKYHQFTPVEPPISLRCHTNHLNIETTI